MTAIVLAGAESTRAATWTRKADMPTPRFGQGTAVVNDKIYAIGGVATETAWLNGKALAAVEQYDLATDTWTRKADLSAPRGYVNRPLPVVEGRIYLIGGGHNATARVDIYDPVTDTWSRGADMPTARQNVAMVTWKNKIYTFGGIRSFSSLQGSLIRQKYTIQKQTRGQRLPLCCRDCGDTPLRS